MAKARQKLTVGLNRRAQDTKTSTTNADPRNSLDSPNCQNQLKRRYL
jgi:hypothetical protein